MKLDLLFMAVPPEWGWAAVSLQVRGPHTLGGQEIAASPGPALTCAPSCLSPHFPVGERTFIPPAPHPSCSTSSTLFLFYSLVPFPLFSCLISFISQQVSLCRTFCLSLKQNYSTQDFLIRSVSCVESVPLRLRWEKCQLLQLWFEQTFGYSSHHPSH